MIPFPILSTAYVSLEKEFSSGCIVRVKTVVSRFAKIGEACILKMGVLGDHYVEIGESCYILIGSVLKNRVKIKPLSKVESLTVV